MTKLESWKIRCADCVNLRETHGEWTCEECFNQRCKDIDDCPEGITAEQIEEIEKATKENKPKLKARSEKAKEKKPREKKIDFDKVEIISKLADFLNTEVENVKITNESKLIEFDFNENHYKLDLIRQRKPKK